jgi:protein-S-isoprenylcysteine O-methyltransferase Ste14
MPSSNALLFSAFLIEQLYALNYHFPHPPSGLVYPQSLQLLKFLSTTAALLAWTPIARDSWLAPAYITTVASLFFLSSLCLFAWTAITTQPRQLSVIYGRVTPTYVLSSGPLAYLRHPTYVAYALGWLGVAVRVIGSVSMATGTNADWIPAPLRIVSLLSSVLGLFWLYRRGAVLEEEQFLKNYETVPGHKVGKDVTVEYSAYTRRVPNRWIPRLV